jgi:hypothetical protein
MTRHLAWFFLAVVMLAVSAPLQALNYEVGVCKTGSSYVTFTTISAAVAGVPAGATILVCPGVYPEQVTITQPLTLKGIASGNTNRAVIAINANGSLAPNVTSGINGLPFYAQVLVENVNPVGPVNMVGVTVDGSGANLACSASLAGIFYASGTSGTVNEVTTRNQENSGCGYGIWVENGAATSESITIENSSVHNVSNGISALSVTPPTLAASIHGNFLSSVGSSGIQDSVDGSAMANFITSAGRLGIAVNDDLLVVSGNTLADITASGIQVEFANAVQSNKLSHVGDSIALLPDTVVTVKSNTIMNTFCGVDFSGGSTTGAISGNVINDSLYGFANWFGPDITGNLLANIDNVQTTSASCP